MSKQRRTFSAEFKREAAVLVLDQGYSVAKACQSLGLVDSALRRGSAIDSTEPFIHPVHARAPDRSGA